MCAHWYPEGYVLPPSTAFPPGPQHPAYTLKLSSPLGAPRPWLTPQLASQGRHSSGTQRSSASSQSYSSSSVSAPQELARIAGVGDPGLVAGVDYFKIGETVRVRRLTASNTHTDWAYGQVTRPPYEAIQKPERVYYVAYVDPRTGARKENEFSYYRKEIAPLAERRGSQPLVFALLPYNSLNGPVLIWTPAYVVDNSDFGVQVRVASGPTAHSHFDNVQYIVPYNTSVARSLKAAGQTVAGDGRILAHIIVPKFQ
ncbi:hypothetical protein BT96DRAFT_1003996 [Gymnopus androsaceus JB14]|uniref:Uncharacterized protein n=1 Tax=Gymnopus androsaceus JB14 TaxID=1447944 RepID=A0A6A4GU37_9AGAR|nr:hypothetical protein BT96DRAFT_1003996 [Gymnopus androsaceus JB14]